MELGPQFTRINIRPEQVVQKSSFGDTWFEVPGYGMLSGPPVEHSDLPHTVYHATTNLSDLRSSGVLRAGREDEMGAGLGGGHRGTVSLTTRAETANQLAQDMHEYASLVQTRNLPTVLERLRRKYEQVGRLDAFDDVQRTYDSYTGGGRPVEPERFGSLAHDLISAHHWIWGRIMNRPNPLIMGGVGRQNSPWWTVNPNNVGVVHIPTSSIPREALVSSFDNHYSEGRHGLWEVRVHGDVPLHSARFSPVNRY